MDLVLGIMMMVIYIMEIGLKIFEMDMENMFLLEDKNILDILKMIKRVDLD